MKEHDLVILTQDMPEHGLLAGDVGTVVLVHEGEQGYEAEFATLDGETVAVVTLEAWQIRPIGRHEIAHARSVAG